MTLRIYGKKEIMATGMVITIGQVSGENRAGGITEIISKRNVATI